LVLTRTLLTPIVVVIIFFILLITPFVRKRHCNRIFNRRFNRILNMIKEIKLMLLRCVANA